MMLRKCGAPAILTAAIAGALALWPNTSARAESHRTSADSHGSTDVTIVADDRMNARRQWIEPLDQTGISSPVAVLAGISLGSAALVILLGPRK